MTALPSPDPGQIRDCGVAPAWLAEEMGEEQGGGKGVVERIVGCQAGAPDLTIWRK